MAQLFQVPNYPDINLLDSTVLTADAAAGQKVIHAVGLDGFATGNATLLGPIGSLVGELLYIDTLTTTTITFLTNLVNAHRQTEPCTLLFGDYIRMYRAPNVNGYPPDDSVFLANLQSTILIDADQPTTPISDAAGSSSYWYKFTYYNSITFAETTLASSIALRGGGFGHLVAISSIRTEAGLLNDNQVQDTQIAERRDQAESEIFGALLAADYTLPLTDNNNQPYVPPVLENLARLLSAGYVLTQDYGPIASGNSKDGDLKVKTALGLLTEIQNHTVILADITGKQMSTAARVRGTPTALTSYTGNNILAGSPPEPPLFTISAKY